MRAFAKASIERASSALDQLHSLQPEILQLVSRVRGRLAGSIDGSGKGRGRFRFALAIRGVSLRGGGSGAPSFRLAGLLAPLALTIAALLGLAAAPAFAAPPAQFGTEGTGAGQINEPRGIAVDQQSHDLYIADRNNNRVDKFDPFGTFIRAFIGGLPTGAPA